jgi:hypothetical protein
VPGEAERSRVPWYGAAVWYDRGRGVHLLHGSWYSTDEVAELLGVDASTLRRRRTSTPVQEPPFVRLTSRVTMYSVPDVQAWLTFRRVDPAKVA